MNCASSKNKDRPGKKGNHSPTRNDTGVNGNINDHSVGLNNSPITFTEEPTCDADEDLPVKIDIDHAGTEESSTDPIPLKIDTADSDSETSSHNENGEVSVKFDVEQKGIELGYDQRSSHPFTEHVDWMSVTSVLQSDIEDVDDFEMSQDLIVQYITKSDKKHLKNALRSNNWSVNDEIRKLLWKQICKHLHKADEHDIYGEFAMDLFAQGDTSVDIRIPSFVDIDHVNTYHLSHDGITCAKKILCVLEHSNPDIVHSPLLFSLVSLFLHYMDTSDCYNCIYSLLRSKDGQFIPQTRVSSEGSKLVMRDLSKKYAKSGYVLLVRNCSNIDAAFDSWIWWIFQDLPFSYLIRILDCYLKEGVKIFYRVTLAILILFAKSNTKKSFNSPKTEGQNGSIVNTLRQFCREIPVKIDKLLKMGFSIRGLTRKEIRRLQVKNEMYITSIKHINSHHELPNMNKLTLSRSFSGPIVLQNLGSNMLSVDMLFAIWTWLPTRYAVCQPELLYTSEEDGTSLVTLYQRVENHQPTVIVIKTLNDEIFGAFCSSYWRERRQSSPNLSYFGTGETFIFTLMQDRKKYEWVGLSEENIPNTANMFQAGDRSILTIGGGHGEAIFLDENLLHCRTEKCDTFKNEPLCEHEDFQCKVVEVYGFQ